MNGVRRGLLALLVVGALAAALPSAAHAQTVRGRLVRQTPAGILPVANVRVTVTPLQGGTSSAPAYSGPDGMFYLPNVAPGDYHLEIWVGQTPRRVAIRVSAREYVDVPPVAL